MTDRDMDRERRMRESENDNDWDWYYYEYRYEPYNSGRNFGNREGFARDYNRNYGRSYGQNYGRNYGQDYGRGYEQDYRNLYGRNYGQGYGRNSDYDTSPYWMTGNQTPGRYSGVGPRGYRRSDERIMEDINDRLTWDGQIDATDIQVDVKDGVATLTGSVNSRQDKRMAEYIAEDVSGVSDVQNNLKINKQTDWNRGYGGSETNQGMQEETTETSKKKR